MMLKYLMLAAAASGFFAVALGAFASHVLKAKLDAYSLNIWTTANQYHIYHTLALLVVLLLLQRIPHAATLLWSAVLMLVGIVVFSGSLYALALTGLKYLGAITPMGGLCFLMAWVLLFVGILKHIQQ